MEQKLADALYSFIADADELVEKNEDVVQKAADVLDFLIENYEVEV